MKRVVDRTKKANIKCEHCEHFVPTWRVCTLKGVSKYYWNRCKEFKWRDEQ